MHFIMEHHIELFEKIKYKLYLKKLTRIRGKSLEFFKNERLIRFECMQQSLSGFTKMVTGLEWLE